MATLPPSLQTLLRIVTDHGTYNPVDPGADPAGYRQLLTDSASRRNRLDQAHDDAANDAMGDLGVKARLMGQPSRMQANNAAQGFNAQWQPWLEAFSVLGDNNPGKTVKTDAASMTGVPLGAAPRIIRPPMQLPIDLTNPGPTLPLPEAFEAQPDPRGFPDLGRRITTPSMRALAKQGGY